jgi:hypothetical protein
MLKCKNHNEIAVSYIAFWKLKDNSWYSGLKKGEPFCKQCTKEFGRIYAEGKDSTWLAHIYPIKKVDLKVKKITL